MSPLPLAAQMFLAKAEVKREQCLDTGARMLAIIEAMPFGSTVNIGKVVDQMERERKAETELRLRCVGL
jgi:hypothetical protein